MDLPDLGLLLEGYPNALPMVFDVGSWSVRVGSAADPEPREEIPSVVAYLSDDGSGIISLDPECYVADPWLVQPRTGVDVKNFMKNGLINDWDLFEKIIEYSYSKTLRAEPQDFPVLFTEMPYNTPSIRETLTELMFEKYNVQSIGISQNNVIPLFFHPSSSGIVIDSGEVHTTVIPILNGNVMTKAVTSIPMGGRFSTMMCGHLLRKKNIELFPACMVEKKLLVEEKQKPIWTKRKLPPVSTSWYNYNIVLAMEDFKHSVLEVPEKSFNERTMANLPTRHYEFFNGYNQKFGSERFGIVESFFDPSVGSNHTGIGNLFMATLSRFNEDDIVDLIQNVIPTGGNTLIKGFQERLNDDLMKRMPEAKGILQFNMTDSSTRRTCAWLGASILGRSSNFQEMCFTRKEYDDNGKASIHSRVLGVHKYKDR